MWAAVSSARELNAVASVPAVLTPGKINLLAFKKSSGVTFSGIDKSTAMPGNLVVWVAHGDF